MKEKLVTGVLNRNSSIRDEHLRRNYGKYSQYKEELVPAIGEVYNINYQRPLDNIINGQSLLEYTSNTHEDYGRNIDKKYFNGREKEIIGYENLTPDQIQAWGGKYLDYITYLDEVIGEDVFSRHVRYINDFLSGQYMENALRQTEVGVVRNINVPIARQGIITTNPNNLKGVDTPLGTITNYMYSTLLYNGAIFNSDRKSEEKYITPSLINQYGNNLANVAELGDILRVGTNDYRLREDLGANANIIHSFKDTVTDLNLKWLTKNIDEAKKYLDESNKDFKGYELGKDSYVKYTEGSNKVLDTDEFIASSNFKSEYNQSYIKTYDIYNENDNANIGFENAPDNEDESAWEHYESIDGSVNEKSILSKTASLYNDHKINTLIGRFHTSIDGGIPTEQEFIDTAKSKYGNSHGRNLLTRKAQDSENVDADDTNGYDNPYCRTWTYHHQYDQVKKLIRPFITEEDGQEIAMDIKDIQKLSSKYRSKDEDGKIIGADYLGNNTVLNKNGFVNICPSENSDKNVGVPISKCMFSIENLAWKDVPKFSRKKYISKEQTGPNGGRIMWFPPYDLSFSENVNVEWQQNTFIGRGEKVYTYTNTDRSGTLSFTLLIDHPSIVNSFAKLDNGDISSDINSDILRFFAGCEFPDIKDPEEEVEKTVQEGEPEPQLEPQHGTISFYVYFPNNYSGMVSKKSVNEKNIIDIDQNWWEYILVGNNCNIYSDIENWVGYEITSNKGLSSNEPIGVRNTWIGVSDCWWNTPGDSCIGDNSGYNENDAVDENGSIVVNKELGEWCYKYRVDKDLRQKLGRYTTPPNPINDSFKDDTSYQLNTYLNTDEYQKDAKYTFGEFIAALIDSKKIELNYINADNLLNFLISNGCDNGRISELAKIFSTDGLKIDTVDIKGSADNNDPKNADMLSERRAFSIYDLLKNMVNLGLTDETKFSWTGKKSNEIAENLPSTKKNKLQRYAFVTLDYTLPGTKQNQSDSNQEATTKPEQTLEEEEADENMFNEWFTKLVDNSTLIKEYDIIFDNEDYEISYDLFNDEIKNWCLDNGISYNLEDYQDSDQGKEKWNNVVNQLIETYGYEYFVPALKMTKRSDNLGNDFLVNLKMHQPLNASDIIDNNINSLNGDIARDNEQIQSLSSQTITINNQITQLNEQKTSIEEKISECNTNIEEYNTKIERLNEQIDSINYELNHWTTESRDRRILERELKQFKKDLDKTENNKQKEETKKQNYQNQIDNINSQIQSLQKDAEDIEKSSERLRQERDDIILERNNLNTEKENGDYLGLDSIKGEVYFQKMYELKGDITPLYKGDKSDGTSSDYIYIPFSGGEQNNLFEIPVTMSWSDFPYKGYDCDTCDTSFLPDGTVGMSYNHLLREYFVIKKLDEKLEKGFEFGCEYLNTNEADYLRLKDLLFYQYLLSGDKDDTDTGWFISTNDINGTAAGISYYDAWEYIIKNVRDGKSVINYQPFTDAVREVNEKIEEYRINQTQTNFNKLKTVLNENTNSVLKYSDTVSEDIMKKVIDYASKAYNAAAKAAKEDNDNKNSQKLQKKYKAECETLNNKKDELDKLKDQYLYSVFVGSGITRYETESEYFEKLDIEHPLIFKSIKEKFKYFNPAFHSMSPEGFNARLNFLHQCTRQGHTYESGQNNITTAHNLAFGRMPICVLRIGDFINTRIIINNVNINYDNNGIQWDLNPEGIGVQPMYAKVNLGITIIGGQSLDGPISRLQNAVSFNYYANTGVYDDRSDRYHINKMGNIDGFDKIFTIGGEDNEKLSPEKYNLFVNSISGNIDYIEDAKKKKESYTEARKAYNDSQLTEGNDSCKK